MHRSEGLIMPAIPLRSDQNRLRSPCDPHINQPSIRLRSVAIPLLLSPLIPRADRSPALGRWARRSGDRKKGRDTRRGKAPRCRHACRNREAGASRRYIMRPPGRQANRLPWLRSGRALPMRFPLLRAEPRLICKPLIALLNRERPPIYPNHVESIGKGFSRALSHELQHSWKLTRAQGRRSIACQIPRISAEKTRRMGAWGRNRRACRNFISLHAHAPAFKKFGGPLSENFVGHC